MGDIERSDLPEGSFTIRWDKYGGAGRGGYRLSIPNYKGGEVVPADAYRGAVKALERIAAIEPDVELSHEATAARHAAALRNAVEIARAAVGGQCAAPPSSQLSREERNDG